MAIKPQDSDSFLREVDEELRKDRLNSILTHYGRWIIAGVIALLAALGGYLWWQHTSNEASGELSDRLSQVIDQIEQNNARGAAAGIDELAGSDRVGYRIAGLFSRANAQISTNAIPAAIATLQTIIDDPAAPQPYRDAAIIRKTQLEYDRLTAAQVVERLRSYAVPGNPWFGTAGELVGIALIRGGRMEEAGQMFGNLARDNAVPESIRARALQMASTMGVDAIDIDPGILTPPPPQPGAPAQPGAEAPQAPAGAAPAAGNAAGAAPAPGAPAPGGAATTGAAPRPAAPARAPAAPAPAGNSQ